MIIRCARAMAGLGQWRFTYVQNPRYTQLSWPAGFVRSRRISATQDVHVELTMDRRGRDYANELDQSDAASIAQSLQEDFVGLIAIFDRQLTSGYLPTGKKRSKITEARAAAERGVRLSERLVQLLRNSR